MHKSHMTEVTMSAAPLDNSSYQPICKYSTRWVVTGLSSQPDWKVSRMLHWGDFVLEEIQNHFEVTIRINPYALIH